MALTRRRLLGSLGGTAVVGTVGTSVFHTAFAETDRQPTVLVAGSLLELATAVGGAAVEAHGSAAVRRLVVENTREPDAVALADPTLFAGIDADPTLFAMNELVVAFDPDSPVAPALRRDWQAAIQRSDVDLGRTDPDLDPLGYRTVMALRLAGERTDLEPARVLDQSTIVPETDLMNVLEAGELDAAVTYRSMAHQRELPVVSLPDWLNFGDPAHADQYRQASYELGGTTIRGAPIRYGVTALTEAGQSWVEKLITDRERLERLGFGVPAGYPKRTRQGSARHEA